MCISNHPFRGNTGANVSSSLFDLTRALVCLRVRYTRLSLFRRSASRQSEVPGWISATPATRMTRAGEEKRDEHFPSPGESRPVSG